MTLKLEKKILIAFQFMQIPMSLVQLILFDNADADFILDNTDAHLIR